MDFDQQDDIAEEEEFLCLLNSLLGQQYSRYEAADFEDDLVACAGIIVHGLEEARRIRTERRLERRLYLTRPDLLPNPRADTPWQILHRGRNNRAFITTMGFDVRTFELILEEGFARVWESTPIPRSDVPSSSAPRIHRRSLDAPGALGLVLHFLNSTMVDTNLCQIFAIIPTTVSRYIAFSIKILLATLRKMEDAKIRWPVGDEFQDNNTLIVARHPLLTGAFGSLDGLNLAVQTSKDQEIENATFNGWLHEHFVSSVLAFSPYGMSLSLVRIHMFITKLTIPGDVMGCHLNAPGSWHDSRVAKPIYEKLRSRTPEGYYLVADTAFPRGSDQISGRIRAPVKEGTRLPGDLATRKEMEKFDRQLLSYRQTAEWGNRTIQGTFGRLRVPLPINYGDLRADLLESCIRLCNLRTRSVGYNQTRTVYKDVWSDEENLWLSFEHMIFSEQRQNDRVGRFYMIFTDD